MNDLSGFTRRKLRWKVIFSLGILLLTALTCALTGVFGEEAARLYRKDERGIPAMVLCLVLVAVGLIGWLSVLIARRRSLSPTQRRVLRISRQLTARILTAIGWPLRRKRSARLGAGQFGPWPMLVLLLFFLLPLGLFALTKGGTAFLLFGSVILFATWFYDACSVRQNAFLMSGTPPMQTSVRYVQGDDSLWAAMEQYGTLLIPRSVWENGFDRLFSAVLRAYAQGAETGFRLFRFRMCEAMARYPDHNPLLERLEDDICAIVLGEIPWQRAEADDPNGRRVGLMLFYLFIHDLYYLDKTPVCLPYDLLLDAGEDGR